MEDSSKGEWEIVLFIADFLFLFSFYRYSVLAHATALTGRNHW
jgi:hypothetical protein